MLRDGPLDDPVFLIGADELVDFPSWKEPEAVLELARLGVATRPGFELPSADSPDRRHLLRDRADARVSSREIRAQVAAGEPIDGLVPPAVAAEIAGSASTAARLARSRPGDRTD